SPLKRGADSGSSDWGDPLSHSQGGACALLQLCPHLKASMMAAAVTTGKPAELMGICSSYQAVMPHFVCIAKQFPSLSPSGWCPRHPRASCTEPA
ncbi:hypothetical protein JRQ81_002422, partial [Phrynocephalus forsythii]